MNSVTQIRNERLIELSQLVVDGEITYKLDHIATINMDGHHYFSVFRRYNSPYNIIIEDNNYDIYLHQDYTIRKSLQQLLCLPDYKTQNIYTHSAISYKHNGPVPSLPYNIVDIADMRWTEVQTQYNAISVNFTGIFNNPIIEEAYSTPISKIHTILKSPPGAPKQYTNKEIAAANALIDLTVPHVEIPQVQSEYDPARVLYFEDTNKRDNYVSCYCQMDESEDDCNPSSYIKLRSGRLVPK